MRRLNVAALSNLIAELGFIAAVLYLLNRLLLRASGGRVALHCFNLVILPLTWRLSPALKSRSNVEVRRIYPHEMRSDRIGPSEEEVARRFHTGDRCIAALVDGNVAGYAWVAHGHFDETIVRCRFVLSPPDQVAWDFDLSVDEAHRGGMTFAVLWDGVLSLLRDWGYGCTASRISIFNAGSTNAHRRLGSETVGKLMFLCLGSWQLMIGTVSPYLHFSSRTRRGPTVLLSPRSDMRACDGRLAPG